MTPALVFVRVIVAGIAGVVALVVAAPVLLIGLPFWLVGVLTRVLARGFARPVMRWPALIEFDETVGWRPRPNLDGRCLEERDDDFRVVTDAEGWPGRHSLADSQIVALGDSHVFGYGVDAGATYWARSSIPVKGLGAPGYNMVQELLLLRQLAPRLHGKLVAWFVYIGNDLFDNLSPEMNGYRAPFVATMPGGGWRIVTRHLSRAAWTASSGRRGRFHLPALAAIHSPTLLAERAYGACRFLIGQARDVCAGAGARLAVVVNPTPLTLTGEGLALLARHAPPDATIDAVLPERMLCEIAADLRVPCLLLREHLDRSHFKGADDHWTERGHRRVAAALGRLHRASPPSPPREAPLRAA